VKQAPDAADWLARGREHLQTRDFDSAERCLRSALAQDARASEAYELLGKLLYRDGRSAEAAAVYREWLHAVPAHPVAAHLAAATGSGCAPVRASDAFIVNLYERAAPDFDATLASLGYRAPQLVVESARAVLDSAGSGLDVLDAGCGTGLCGELLRPLARRLVGVDLSAAMLTHARARGCYDEVYCQELTAYLLAASITFDLIVAADVFCYFGNLQAAFAAVARGLNVHGCFVFSVEELTDPSDGECVVLLEHGRYAHTLRHIDSALAATALKRMSLRSEMLRFERGAPVTGLIVAAARASASAASEAPRAR
jgi:predicted TPR repeat methyltransferase